MRCQKPPPSLSEIRLVQKINGVISDPMTEIQNRCNKLTIKNRRIVWQAVILMAQAQLAKWDSKP